MPKNTDKMKANLENILARVAMEMGVLTEDIKGRSRVTHIKIARQIYMYCARKSTSYSLESISEIVNRDHSTSIWSCNVIEAKMLEDHEIKTAVNNILADVKGDSNKSRIKYLKSVIWKYQQELTILENL